MILPLRNRRDFARLAADGEVRSAGPLRVRRAVDPHGENALVAFALPRSVGSAVVRNRLRRQLREALRQLDRRGGLPPGRYLLIATPEATRQSFNELQAIVARLIEDRRV